MKNFNPGLAKKAKKLRSMKKYRSLKRGFLALLPGILFIFLSSCGSGQSAAEQQQEFQELAELVESRQFEIVNDWALPLRGSRVNLIGNTNFIRFEGDSINAQLPFYGVRHSGGGYSSGYGGFEFEGIPENLQIEHNREDGKIVIAFEANDENENMNFNIILYSNGTARTSVTSSQRDSMSYQGEVSVYRDDEDN